MTDTINIIDKAITEHHLIRENIKLTGDSVNDIEALFTLRKAYSSWTQSSIEELATKQAQLLQAVNALEEGLKRHFGFEEKFLPPLFGELLMKAIRHEHQEIARQIQKVKDTLNGFEMTGHDPRKLNSKRALIQETINHVLQAVEEHANHEEIILKMMKKALETSYAP